MRTNNPCECKMRIADGRVSLPPENMVESCPIHGAEARKALEAAAADRGPFTITYLGERFYPLDPRPEAIKLGDIAHALALICRFGGMCRSFYSVAQHSVHVSEQMQEHLRPAGVAPGDASRMPRNHIVQCMHGLLHDGSEAYLGDIVTPIKSLPGMRDYATAEQVVQWCVCSAFGLPEEPSKLLHIVDARMMLTEAHQLMTGEWPPAKLDPYDMELSPMGPMAAETRFLDRFAELAAALKAAPA